MAIVGTGVLVEAAGLRVGFGVGDGLEGAAVGGGVAGLVAAGAGDGEATAPPVSEAHAGASPPGGEPHTDRVDCTHADPPEVVRDSETSTKGWRAELGAPQVPLSQRRSSVAVSPSIDAVGPVLRHRPPTSSPRAYKARTSLSKLMKSEPVGGNTFASPRPTRKVS